MFSTRYGLWQIKRFSKKNTIRQSLGDKAFKIASDPKYYGYQRGLASMVYKCFDKKSKGSGIANEPNYQLANKLYKRIIRKFKKRKFINHLQTIFGVLI